MFGENAEIHLIDKGINEEEQLEDLEDDIEDKPQLEARVVSKRIEELVGTFDVYDKKTATIRKARYSDIVILLRATKGYTDSFITELSNKNIPVYADVNSGYFENMEVQVILALLKIIDNPYQDIPLVAVLRSKIGDFDANELTDIRLADKNCSFYEAMQKAAGQGNNKVLEFLDKLSNWRTKSKYLRLGELVWCLYQETNYYDYVSVMPNGNRRKANLDALLEKAEKYDSSSYRGLFNFINFIDNLKESSGDMSSSKTIGDTENVVRMMSIHKSKGLEFPIVFLCGTGRKFNKREERNPIIMHQDFGFGADVVNLDKRLTYESVPKISVKQKIKEEALSEEVRILYVALTRAREKLIITCLDNNISKREENWGAKQTSYSVANSKSFADWVCSTVLNHENDWKIYHWSYTDVLKLNNNEEKNTYHTFIENITNNFKLTEEYENINTVFQWKYPYAFSTKLPSKITVTELKRLGDDVLLKEDNISNLQQTENLLLEPTSSKLISLAKSPKFMQKEEYDGAKFGTLMHHMMQRIDFNENNFGGINREEFLSNLEEQDRQKVEYYLEQFMHTNLYQEIKKSKNRYREIPFNLSLKLKDVYGNFIADESRNDEILVQGVIDLYFETESGIVLVDYKTDYLKTEEEFIKRYRIQLDYYKTALEKLTGKKVDKVIIYAFYMNKEIVLPINSKDNIK